eukprot:Rmarinus@m.12691
MEEALERLSCTIDNVQGMCFQLREIASVEKQLIPQLKENGEKVLAAEAMYRLTQVKSAIRECVVTLKFSRIVTNLCLRARKTSGCFTTSRGQHGSDSFLQPGELHSSTRAEVDADGNRVPMPEELRLSLERLEDNVSKLEARVLTIRRNANSSDDSPLPHADAREYRLRLQHDELQLSRRLCTCHTCHIWRVENDVEPSSGYFEQPRGSDVDVKTMRPCLVSVIQSLRGVEKSFDFQAAIVQNQATMAKSTSYSTENFAYGSTPLHTWWKVFSCAPVRTQMFRMAAAGMHPDSHSDTDTRLPETAAGNECNRSDGVGGSASIGGSDDGSSGSSRNQGTEAASVPCSGDGRVVSHVASERDGDSCPTDVASSGSGSNNNTGPPVPTLESNSELPPTEFVVFGSSIGWMVFYGRICYDVRCVGYEIMPELHHVAESVTSDHSISEVKFHCEDMLQADLSRCGVLLLTSQCWDHELCHKVVAKISKEAALGTIVVDYSPNFDNNNAFRLVEKVRGCVSWNPSHTFYVYERCYDDATFAAYLMAAAS